MTDGVTRLSLSVWDAVGTDKPVCPSHDFLSVSTSAGRPPPSEWLCVMQLYAEIIQSEWNVWDRTNIYSSLYGEFSSRFIMARIPGWVTLEVGSRETKQKSLVWLSQRWCHWGWPRSSGPIFVTVSIIYIIYSQNTHGCNQRTYRKHFLSSFQWSPAGPQFKTFPSHTNGCLLTLPSPEGCLLPRPPARETTFKVILDANSHILSFWVDGKQQNLLLSDSC